MRGLEIRTKLAMANVVSCFDIEQAECLFTEALYDAIDLGHSDAHKGITEPPEMFKDEPHLLGGWRDGQIDVEVDQIEMA